MGTDIHVVAQIRKAGVWEDFSIDGYEIENRNYGWFTFLCGVRSRGDGIVPIAECRGAPEGFRVDPRRHTYDVDTEYKGKWMGYGVASWVTMREILDGIARLPSPIYPGWPLITQIGPIDELKRLFVGHQPEDCRIVFGFDS